MPVMISPVDSYRYMYVQVCRYVTIYFTLTRWMAPLTTLKAGATVRSILHSRTLVCVHSFKIKMVLQFTSCIEYVAFAVLPDPKPTCSIVFEASIDLFHQRHISND